MLAHLIYCALVPETVSIENPGIRLELFLKEVSRQTGVGFHCPTSLKNEVLAASFKDQSIDVLKSQLARVIHGTWEQKDDGWWLVQTSDQKKEEEKWHRDLRRKAIQDLIDAAKANLPGKEWTIKEADQYRQEGANMRQPNRERVNSSAERRRYLAKAPSGRFMASLFSQLKPEMFPLDLLEPDFQLYTINASKIGKELPLDLAKNLEILDRESFLVSITGEDSDIQRNSQHVIVNMPNSFPLRPDVTTYDNKWQMTSYNSPSLLTPTIRVNGELFAPSKLLSEIVAALSYRPTYYEETGKLVDDKSKMEPIWSRVNATFLDALNRDPLGLFQGQSWLDFAREKMQPMLASLCDNPVNRDPKLMVPTPNQTQTNFFVKRDDADGWIVGRPVDPLWNRSHRIDRTLILDYVKRTMRDELATIEDQVIATDIGFYARAFCYDIPNVNLLQNDIRSESVSCAMFGAALRAGIRPDPQTGIIDIQKLPRYAQGELYGNYMDGTLLRLVMDEEYSGICPQFLMPNGIRGIYLKVVPSFEPTFEVKNEAGTSEVLLLSTFAFLVAENMDEKVPLDKLTFRLGRVRTMKVSLCLGERSMDSELFDPFVGPLVASSWNSMPADVKKMVLDKIRERATEPPKH